MIITLIVIGYLMLIIVSIQASRSHFSPREIERRLTLAPKHYTLDELRYLYGRYLGQIATAIAIILFAVLVILTYQNYGIYIALIVVVLLAILRRQIARYLFAAKLASMLYRKYEKRLLDTMWHAQNILRILFGESEPADDYQLGSPEELRELVEKSPSILTDTQRRLLLADLQFAEAPVRESMTPSGDVVSVAADEVMGPLVLDDLFKTRQQVFPVIEGDLGHTIGVLEIKELLTLRDKKSQTARTLMVSGVSRVDIDQELLAALEVLLDESSRLAVVVDADDTAVGIVTLNDIVGRLIGRSVRPDRDKML